MCILAWHLNRPEMVKFYDAVFYFMMMFIYKVLLYILYYSSTYESLIFIKIVKYKNFFYFRWELNKCTERICHLHLTYTKEFQIIFKQFLHLCSLISSPVILNIFFCFVHSRNFFNIFFLLMVKSSNSNYTN